MSRPWSRLPTPSWAAGWRAGDVLAAMMPAIDGRGGGKPTLARGGRDNVAGMAAALEVGVARARELLEG